MKLGIVLFNLGGPDSPEAVEPFLRNLFSDPAIIGLPAIVRLPLAWLIARRRAPVAAEIYRHLGGASPILAETEKQARALERVLSVSGVEAKCVIAMRCWHPFSDAAAAEIKTFAPDKIILLPLYPQYSTTTTASSLKDWGRAARAAGLQAATTRVCCYPADSGFVRAMAGHIRAALAETQNARLLLSAHGLPERVIERGDPYQWQVEKSAAAIVEELGMENLDHVVCYQSRVGPLKWLGPSTDAEIRRAGVQGKSLVVAPLAFVSEHSETLVELDIEYARLARDAGVPDYRRCPAVRDDAEFIDGLAALVRKAATAQTPCVNADMGRICPAKFSGCGFRE